MPCEAVRSWIVHMGKRFGPKELKTPIDTIASSLGIKKISVLNACIRDTPTNTTKQIIKTMYTPSELVAKRGADVTHRQRRLIRGKITILLI